jgi:hypothetical protein
MSVHIKLFSHSLLYQILDPPPNLNENGCTRGNFGVEEGIFVFATKAEEIV